MKQNLKASFVASRHRGAGDGSGGRRSRLDGEDRGTVRQGKHAADSSSVRSAPYETAGPWTLESKSNSQLYFSGIQDACRLTEQL